MTIQEASEIGVKFSLTQPGEVRMDVVNMNSITTQVGGLGSLIARMGELPTDILMNRLIIGPDIYPGDRAILAAVRNVILDQRSKGRVEDPTKKYRGDLPPDYLVDRFTESSTFI